MNALESDLLLTLYRTVISPGGWQKSLDLFSKIKGTRGATINRIERSAGLNVVGAYSSIYTEQMCRIYERDYAVYEQRGFENALRQNQTGFQIDLDAMELPDLAALNASPATQFLLQAVGARRRAVSRLNITPLWSDVLAVQYPEEVLHVTAEMLADTDYLLPHFATAMETSRTFDLLRLRYKAVLEMLDKINLGLVIVSPNRDVVIANQEAYRIADAVPALRIGGDNRLTLADSDQAAALDRAVQQCAATSDGEGTVNGVKIRAGGSAAEDEPLLLDVSPLSDDSVGLGRRFFGAMIFITSLSNPTPIDVSCLKTAFLLTSAEAEVASLHASGHATKDVAEIRRVSTETVKTQLSSIYRKTGVSSRVGLIKLLMQANPIS